MTTRTGQPERPPNLRSKSRLLSGTNAIQRPPRHRSVPQQYTSSPSSSRITSENFVDLTLDSSDGPTARTIRRSRLNLEIGQDSKNDEVADSPKQTIDVGPASKPLQPPRGRPQLHYEVADSPKQTIDVGPASKPLQPPRGRPQLHFDVPSASNLSPPTGQDRVQNEVALKSMPLPGRPRQHAPPASIDKMRSAPSSTGRKDTRPKPYHLEVPAPAPRFPTKGYADFFPWAGNQPEDGLSESSIRHGFYDKAQMTRNETGSAKSSVLPALKHKSGVQTLSSLFTNILVQRRAHGQITSASTFKPPPRVTVTDTKREMWLKDLANPAISLRRLSRSIPHGIRGKVLLEQSLGKNIPMERAVWLAKCVGANELRSFRRKGVSGTFVMGGEAKWIREFTASVEQFLESIVGTCGEKDFKIRIGYAMRLATSFYAEYLLDREHYMDWVVSTLETSSEARLPMWLLITQIYWKDLLKHRKYGRRLSTALLNHLAEILNHPDCDILAPISNRLKFLLKELVRSNPDSFISPTVWLRHEELIRANLTSNDGSLTQILARITLRNARLTGKGTEKQHSPRKRLIKLLDTTISQPVANNLPQKCWSVDDNKPMLARVVLEWSTSAHRPGIAKIYIAARILRFWSRSGADITEIVLDFLDSGDCESGRNKTAFYHLISELARSQNFSTSRYLQWLMGRGGLYDASDISDNGPLATRLLAELPTHNLSDSITGLRKTLLSRAEFPVDDEEEQTRHCIVLMNRTLPGMQATVNLKLESYDNPITSSLADLITNASQTSKSEIGLWLREKVNLQMFQPIIPPFDDWDKPSVKKRTSAITLSDFNTVRNYLERIDDYSMLADILKIVSSSKDANVLACCADTINLHLDTFSAVGALKPLFDLLMARWKSLAEDANSVPRVFLVSLSDLASRVPEQRIIAQRLSRELARSDRKTAADACSPVSDHMSLMQTTESNFTDKIDKVLASGNSMDRATLERLFQRIVLRLEESFEKSTEQRRRCGLLLTRLKIFDAKQFNILMTAWVTRFLLAKTRPNMLQVLGPLISFGCLTLPDAIASLGSNTVQQAASNRPGIFVEALALLSVASALPEGMTFEEGYRLRIEQAHMQKDNPVGVLNVIRRSLEERLTADEVHRAGSDSGRLLECRGMCEFLQRLILMDTDAVTQGLVVPLLQRSEPCVNAKITTIVNKFLLGRSSESMISAEEILSIANDLTLPFCQLKLASMFTADDSVMSGTEDLSERLDAFDSAIEAAVTTGKTSWASIVPLLDISVAQHLRQRADRQFLALFPSPRAAITDNLAGIQSHITQAENLLHIVKATAYSIPDASSVASTQPGLASEIVSALNGTWMLLSTSQLQTIKDLVIAKWLPLLISFITIHKSTFEATKLGHESRAKAIIALTAIFLELENLEASTEATTALIEQIYDLALFIVDSLPDEIRVQCIMRLRDVSSSTKVRYLFSFANNPSEWLVLSQIERGGYITGHSGVRITETKEKLISFPLRRWEMLGDPTPILGENDTSLSLRLFGARKS